jgi:osmotically-inducible protein OsmY
MKTDAQLLTDVENELKWEPSVTASEIGVAVSGGVVTLSGTVPTYAEKCAAEKAAWRVAGVKAIAEELQVKPFGSHKRNDTEIAEAAVQALESHVWVPTDTQATVEAGWVTLRGEANWEYQRKAAYDSVRYLPGVIGVINDLTIKPTVQPGAVKDAIEKAL